MTWKVIRRALFVAASCVLLSGCLGPPAVNRALLQYDQSLLQSQAGSLLVNIARVHEGLPLHFIVPGQISASFEFSARAGATPTVGSEPNKYVLDLGVGVAEKPTLTFAVLQGQDYTERLFGSLGDKFLFFLHRRGSDLSLLLRLMARGFYDFHGGPRARSENVPGTPQYLEFRQIVLHLEVLLRLRELQVNRLDYFEEVQEMISPEAPKAADLIAAAEKGYRWKTVNKDGTRTAVLEKRIEGMIALTNFDPQGRLTDTHRKVIHDAFAPGARDTVYVELTRTENNPRELKGYFRVRSLRDVFLFLGRDVEKEKAHPVKPWKETEALLQAHPDIALCRPCVTFEVMRGDDAPQGEPYAISYKGTWVWVPIRAKDPLNSEEKAQADWNREIFLILYNIFQASAVDTSKLLTPPVLTIPIR